MSAPSQSVSHEARVADRMGPRLADLSPDARQMVGAIVAIFISAEVDRAEPPADADDGQDGEAAA